MCHMHRTTIMLPEDLRRSADREAKELGISLSELIRRRLADKGTKAEKSRPRFFSRQPWEGAGTDDIAANHDAYLYGP